MEIYLETTADGIIIRARAEGDDVLGDLDQLIAQGEDFGGIPFADLATLGDGKHEIPDQE